MAGVESKSAEAPDETRDIPNGKLELVNLAGVTFGRATFQPGWKWSESVKPIMGTDSCGVNHNGYCESGTLHVVMDDGSEADIGAGDFFVIPAGHDAWVPGNEPFISLGIDFTGDMASYGKSS
jgi:hypothetical protein